MDAEVLAGLVNYVKTGLIIVQTRILVLIGLLLCAGATAWTLYEPTWERVTASALFPILVFWPIIRLEKTNGKVPAKTN
jgi:hypothetical protein